MEVFCQVLDHEDKNLTDQTTEGEPLGMTEDLRQIACSYIEAEAIDQKEYQIEYEGEYSVFHFLNLLTSL